MNKLLKLSTRRSNWAIPYFIFLMVFVVLPLVLIFIYAFKDKAGNLKLQNFVKFATQPEAVNTFIY